jgi:endonuclease/exonuclease/phosphatase (EEP) superfamily protein YafD
MKKSKNRESKRHVPPLFWPAAGLSWGLVVLSFSNHLGTLHPGLDLIGQFKFQFTLALFLPLLLMLLMRRGRWVAGLLVCLSFNLLEIAPWYWPIKHSKTDQQTAEILKVFLANVHNTNQEVSPLARQIVKEQPDIVVLLEFHPQHLTMMNGMGRAFPYRFKPKDGHYFGLGLWSRHPLNAAHLRFLGQSELPTLDTRVEIGLQEVRLVASHLDSPVRVPAIKRNRQLMALGKYLQNSKPPLLAMGDFNVSQWSPYYKQFEKISGLINCRRGFGVLPTWPSFLPDLARIPIDHCLASPGLTMKEVHAGAPVGSDHLPLIFSLRVPRPVSTELESL